jgi:hypothetical protein
MINDSNDTLAIGTSGHRATAEPDHHEQNEDFIDMCFIELIYTKKSHNYKFFWLMTPSLY